MNKIAVLLLVPTLVVGGAVASTPVVLVDVDAADAPHLVAPVPVPVARAALALAPEEARWVEAPELARRLPGLERAVDALRGADDGVFVRVEDGDERVRVSKDGGLLRVRAVDGPATRVSVDVPFRLAEAVLRAYDRERAAFRSSGLIAALGTAPDGELVRVLDGEEEVGIRVW